MPRDDGFAVFVEERGVQAGAWMAHGSLWARGLAHGRYVEGLAGLRSRHQYSGPLAREVVDTSNVAFFEALLTRFFATDDLMVHTLITRLATSHSPPPASRRRSLGMLLRNKVRFFAVRAGRAPVVHVGLTSPDTGEGERARLERDLALGDEPEVHLLPPEDARSRLGALVAELFVAAWADMPANPAQQRVAAGLAGHLGWPDLRSDTGMREHKLNVWAYYDPTMGVPREFQTRPVALGRS